jgi:formylmethanofuran--tetrahydromethanopterin N-formyltransferase
MIEKIDDTYAEAFGGIFVRIIITAKDAKRLQRAAIVSTALPSIVIGRTEGGIEKWLNEDETPDKRKGAIVQFWGRYDEQKPKESLDRFYKEISYRIRQGILVTPTSAVFNAYDSNNIIDSMERIGHCGDGYEWEEDYKNHHIIKIPLMMGDFVIEQHLGYGFGVMGGNIWLLCKDEDVALQAGDIGVQAVEKTGGAITTFDICSAGSKPETKYPAIGPTTNHLWCPSLKKKISNSEVPNGVEAIPEIVINGITLNAVKDAMRSIILSVKDLEGIVKISAGNYDGKLGKYKIFLRELMS